MAQILADPNPPPPPRNVASSAGEPKHPRKGPASEEDRDAFFRLMKGMEKERSTIEEVQDAIEKWFRDYQKRKAKVYVPIARERR